MTKWIIFGVILLCIKPDYSQSNIMTPVNPFVYVGDELIINCTLDDTTTYNVSSLIFTRGADVEIDKKFITAISDDVAQLRIWITEEDIIDNELKNSMYLCRIPDSEIFGHQVVTAEYKVRQVENVQCKIFNWKSMKCSWDLGPYIDLRKIKVDLQWSAMSFTDSCHQYGGKTSCIWPEDKFNDWTKYVLDITVTYTNPELKVEASVIQSYKITAEVEPAAVTELSSSIIPDRCVLLSWQHEDVFDLEDGKPFRNLNFSIVYNSKWNEEPLSINGLMTRRNHTICNLHPDAKYSFHISIIPRKGGYWSPNSTIDVLTPEDAPSHGPVSVNGSYYQYNCENNQRRLLMYFQHVPEFEQNGAITQYEAVFKTMNVAKEVEVLIHVPPSEYWFETVVDCYQTYQVELKSRNSKGPSRNNSLIFIPSVSKLAPSLADVYLRLLIAVGKTTDKDNSTNNYVEAQWNLTTPSLKPISYRIFWCNSTSATTCQADIKWVDAPGSVFRLKLDVDAKSVESNIFIFAISAIYDEMSSPMVFSSCIYKLWEVPQFAPDKFKIDQKNAHGSLGLRWSPMTCDEQSLVHIQYYNIRYCTTNQNGRCSDQNESKKIESTISNYQLTGLKVGANYSVWIQAESPQGVGPESARLYAVPPDNEKYSDGEIVGFVIAGLSSLILFAVIVVCIYRRACKLNKMDIKLYNETMGSDNQSINAYQFLEDEKAPSVDIDTIPVTVTPSFEHQISKDSGNFSIRTMPPTPEVNAVAPGLTINRSVSDVDSSHKSKLPGIDSEASTVHILDSDSQPISIESEGYVKFGRSGSDVGSNQNSNNTVDSPYVKHGRSGSDMGSSQNSNNTVDSPYVDAQLAIANVDSNNSQSISAESYVKFGRSGSDVGFSQNSNNNFSDNDSVAIIVDTPYVPIPTESNPCVMVANDTCSVTFTNGHNVNNNNADYVMTTDI